MIFFLLLNTKEDILKNMGKQTVDPIDFHSMETILSICIYFYSTWKTKTKQKTSA